MEDKTKQTIANIIKKVSIKMINYLVKTTFLVISFPSIVLSLTT